MHQPQITLYKTRDFGAKMNATIEYIRYNVRPLLKIILLITAPVSLLLASLYSTTLSTFSELATSQAAGGENFSVFDVFGMNYFLMIVISMLTLTFTISAVYTYMKLKDEQGVAPAIMEVYQKIWPKLPRLMALIIITSIFTVIGFFFLIIPGFYLMITLSLAIPIYLFEEGGIGKALSKSFKLIKGKWWSTFGLLIITALIASITSYVFAIPLYAVLFGKIFSISQTGAQDPEAVFSILSSWYMAAGMAFMMMGTYITGMIPLIALGFQYFNLSERVDGTGIRNQIGEFETVS